MATRGPLNGANIKGSGGGSSGGGNTGVLGTSYQAVTKKKVGVCEVCVGIQQFGS